MTDTPTAPALVTLLDQADRLAAAAERDDLVTRVAQARRRLDARSLRVAVVGEVGQGKSQLVNAILGAPICPVGDGVTTAVPLVVRHGERVTATLVATVADAAPGTEERRTISPDNLGAHLSLASRRAGIARAEVTMPRALLADGLELIDSPGVGGPDGAHALVTLNVLSSVDAVLFVSDASQEFTDPELQFLRQAMRLCPNVAVVLTKIDLEPHWRRIVELDVAHLEREGIRVPVVAVSSVLRLEALRANDRELHGESGFPALLGHLKRNVIGAAETVQHRVVENEVHAVAEHLALAVAAELQSLRDPERTPEMVAGLEAAKERSDDLRRRSAKWQVTLNDGMADLIADMEHDLRDRMRAIRREADESIDQGDPGPVWQEFVDWLEQRIAAAVSDTFVWTDERAAWISGRVAECFSENDHTLPDLRLAGADDAMDQVGFVPDLDDGRLGAMQKVLIGMRGSYGGVLMIGLLTGILGMSLINPISVVAGLLIGGHAYREDREVRLKRRQAEAKHLVHAQVDDVLFQVGKQLRDRLRLVQRVTRDHFTAVAEERSRTLGDSVRAAQRAAQTYSRDRDTRVAALEKVLRDVESLRGSTVGITGAQAPAVAA